MKNRGNYNYNVVPVFFACFGAIVLALFCVFVTIFGMSIHLGNFLINPVYLIMLMIGTGGLLITDVVAITKWKKCKNSKKENSNVSNN